MRILEYRFPGMGGVIKLPNPCGIIHIGEQDGVLHLWAEVPNTDRVHEVKYCIIPTGGYVPAGMVHYRTVLMKDGLVWHVYFEQK